MALFSFGRSKSSASSQSSSLDFGLQGSQSFSDSLAQALSESYGQSSSFGLSVSGGTGLSRTGSTQRVANADILSRLYQDALAAVGRTDTGLFRGQAAQLFSGGFDILDRLGVGAGTDYLSSRVSGESPVLAEQIGALSEDVGRFFREELNPAIVSRGVATGTLGGGRQGVAQGRAAEVAAREFQRGATALRSADIAARDTAAAQLMAGQTQAAGIGLSALPGLLGIAQASLGAELSPYSALAGIIGGPTVLTESFGESVSEQFGRSEQQARSEDRARSVSESIARAISQAFGFNYGTSQSSSTSKGKSLSFGFSGFGD